MSANSTFAVTSPVSSNSSNTDVDCVTVSANLFIFTAFSVTNILLILPLSILVLYLGFQRWRHHRFSSTPTSHSDVFTYHMVAMEMIAILGTLLYCAGFTTNLLEMIVFAFDTSFCFWSTKIQFHSLTCVERYLAVVHPVTYLGLKNSGGVRIRNISIGCVWLLFVWWSLVIHLQPMLIVILYLCLLSFALIVICFCCISVLCALKRSGPGEGCRDREGANQMKQRAFNTVMIITGVLWLCLGGMLVCYVFTDNLTMNGVDGCSVLVYGIWFSLPSSLVLPLLYLHRAGKLPGCRR